MDRQAMTLEAPPPATRARRCLGFPLGLLLPALALIGAEAGVRAGLVPANLLPPPSAILESLSWLLENGLAGHVGASTLRVAAGFGAGALLALPLGALVALNRRAESLLDPSFQALRAIPSRINPLAMPVRRYSGSTATGPSASAGNGAFIRENMA